MKKEPIILFLSLPAVMLTGSMSAVGLFSPGFYHLETVHWEAQSIGQDFMDLILVTPALLISAFLAYRGNKVARSVWAGVNLYLVYTFVIYALDVHFNQLFLLYCLNLGFTFFAFGWYLYMEILNPGLLVRTTGKLIKFIAYYLMSVAVVFYFLWLSEVVPAILDNQAPESLVQAGLITNPVHVLDLAIILPAIFGTGVLLLRLHRLGSILAPVILIFTLLMNVTIGLLMIVMKMRGLEANLVIMGAMLILAAVNAVLFYKIWISRTNPDSISYAI